MNSARLELIVGAFVAAGLAVIAWFTWQVGAGLLPHGGTYDVTARFSDVGGLKPGSPVMIAGVTVGRVQSIALDPRFAAIVQLRLTKNLHLSADTIASIKTSGLIGDKYLALAPGADDRTLAPGGTITETEAALDLESLISRVAFGNVKAAPDAK
jgi:phospholipid/cholesterol/gamma-HCH transport system substrate-binding protein